MNDRLIRVLHVDDDEDFLELASRNLARHDDIGVEASISAEDALERLDEALFDCVVVDYQLGGMDGLELLSAIRERDRDLPVVFFTGRGSEEVAAEAISAGVTDYLRKGSEKQFLLLVNRIRSLTSQRRAEATVRQVYERINEAVLAVDADFRITYCSERAAALFERAADDLLGRDLFETFPGMEGTAYERELVGALEAQTSVVFEAAYEPLEKWLAVTVYPSPDGLTLFARDLTELHEKEVELREMREDLELSESQFRTLRQKMARSAPPFR